VDDAEVCPMRYKAHKTMINRLNTQGLPLGRNHVIMEGFLKHRPQQYTYSANQFSSNKHTAAACLMVDALDHRAL
jgi:hypothetical protein